MVTWRQEPTNETPLDPETTLAGLVVVGEDLRFTAAEIATATTLTADHYLVLVDGSSVKVKITLPPAIEHRYRSYTIKKIDRSKHQVTIDANSTEKIDGDESLVLKSQYAFVTIVSDGDEWFIIGGVNVKLETIAENQLKKQKDIEKLLEKLLTAIRVTNRHQEKTTEKEFAESAVATEAREGLSKRYIQ